MLSSIIMYQNALTYDEVIGLRVIASMACSDDGFVTCEWCHNPQNRIPGIKGAMKRKEITRTRRMYGCIGAAAQNKPNRYGNSYGLSDETQVWKCPRLYQADPELRAYMRLFMPYYSNGVLPEPGGWNQQPAKLTEAFEVLRGELIAIENKRMKKAEG